MNLNLAAVRSLGRPRWKVTVTALPGVTITRSDRYLSKPTLCWTRKRADQEQRRLKGLYTPGTVSVSVEQVGPVSSGPARQWVTLQLATLVAGVASLVYSRTEPIRDMFQGPPLSIYGTMLLASVLMEVLLVAFGETKTSDGTSIRLRAAIVWFAVTDMMAIIVATTVLTGPITVAILVFAIVAPWTLIAARWAKAGANLTTCLAAGWVVTWLGVALAHMSADATVWIGNFMILVGILGCGLTGLAILRPHLTAAIQARAPRPRPRP